MNENNENMNNQNENAEEEIVHEADEFEDVWDDNEAENNEAENVNQNNTKEENIMNKNNQNAQNQNNININGMTNDELKELEKRIAAEKAARQPKWKKWAKRIAIGVGIAGGVAGIGYGVKKIVDNKKTADSCCDNSGVDIESEAARWGVDVV
jgi:hypothetical protein